MGSKTRRSKASAAGPRSLAPIMPAVRARRVSAHASAISGGADAASAAAAARAKDPVGDEAGLLLGLGGFQRHDDGRRRGLAGAGEALDPGHQSRSRTAAAASGSRFSSPQDIERDHVARALPDRVDGRFPVEPGQGALLHVAVAAEAFHQLVEQARRGLADAEFRRRRDEAGEGRLLGVVPARSKLRASRMDKAVIASDSSARSASTLRMSGWSMSFLPKTLRCRAW